MLPPSSDGPKASLGMGTPCRVFQMRRVASQTTRMAPMMKMVISVESIHLDVDQALPCGLILNELLSNALKHAFPDGREGVISVSLKRSGRDGVELQVSDSGIGLPTGFRLETSSSLGLQVVRALIGQLRASLVVSEESGTTFTLSWKTLAGTKLLAKTDT